MIIVRVTFFSRNHTQRFAGSLDDHAAAILDVSAANNRRSGITGGLIYDPHWFAQAIEGPEFSISTTFERILRDERHSEVTLVAMTPVAQRRFTDAMTGVGRGPH